MSNKIIGGLIVLAAIAATVGLVSSHNKNKIATKEGYQDMFSANNYGKNSWVARPTFRADLSPRFDDSGARTGAIVGTPPPYAMMGATTTPVSSIVEGYNLSPTFATMGGTYD